MEKLTVNKSLISDYGIYVESHRHDPDFKTEMHFHPFASLYYVISGKGNCLVVGKEFEVSANSAILIKRDFPHQLIDKSKYPMTVLVVYFSNDIENQNQHLLGNLYRKQFICGISMHRCMTIRNELRKMLDEQHSQPIDFCEAVKQGFSRILLQLKRSLKDQSEGAIPSPSSQFRVQQVLDYVQQRFYEPPSLAEVARLACLSTRQFTNVCRKITGQSYLQYVNFLRIKKSADLLENTSMSVAAIAFETGFEDLSTFYRAFKRYMNTTPQKLREL